MAERPAKIIVNEVTGTGSTSMDGFLEVAGNRADVVIANPNGITVNGGGFINTGKAFLTTGKPVYDGEDHLQRFDITGGDILIEGKGLGGKETESLAILSRAVKINAGIWAEDLHITTGANTVDAKTLEASAIEGKGGRPAFALDTAAIGGMYAGRITLVGTEKGLGVNNSGTWSAEDNLTLDWNGDLKNSGTIYSKGNTDLRASRLENDKPSLRKEICPQRPKKISVTKANSSPEKTWASMPENTGQCGTCHGKRKQPVHRNRRRHQ